MFCTFCGAGIGERFPRFCPQCGAPLQAGNAQTPTDPVPAAPVPDDTTVLLSTRGTVEAPQEPADAIPAPDNSPTLQLFAPMAIGPLLNPTPTSLSQPDDSTRSSTAPTTVFPGGNAMQGRSKKKHKKARGRAKLFAKTIAANATQNEPVFPPNEPIFPPDEPESHFIGETFPPISLDKNDRIVVEPLYPERFPVPVQFSRESIHPAVFGLAAIILIVFLGGLWWWNSKEADFSPEDIDASPPALSSEFFPDAEPSLTLSSPDSPAENTPVFNPEEQEQILEQKAGLEPGSEPGLMGIPSLPANQQQGRHNRYTPPVIEDDSSPSLYPLPMPAPPIPARPSEHKQAIVAPPESIERLENFD